MQFLQEIMVLMSRRYVAINGGIKAHQGSTVTVLLSLKNTLSVAHSPVAELRKTISPSN